MIVVFNMPQGLNANTVLRIGFLNDKVEERMAAYTEAYDVVLTGVDASLDYVNGILKQLTPPP